MGVAKITQGGGREIRKRVGRGSLSIKRGR